LRFRFCRYATDTLSPVLAIGNSVFCRLSGAGSIPIEQKFFASFFQKRCFLLPLNPIHPPKPRLETLDPMQHIGTNLAQPEPKL